jgi:hypothetical protein
MNNPNPWVKIDEELREKFPSVYSSYVQAGWKQAYVWFEGKEDSAIKKEIEDFLKDKAPQLNDIIVFFNEKKLSQEQVGAQIFGVIGIAVSR